MPDDNAYRSLIERGQVGVPSDLVDTYEQRRVIDLSSDRINVIDATKIGFWEEFKEVLVSQDFLNSPLRAFAP
jgi:hypothetical protein